VSRLFLPLFSLDPTPPSIFCRHPAGKVALKNLDELGLESCDVERCDAARRLYVVPGAPLARSAGWKIYPATVEFRIRRIRGRGDLWVAETSIRYDGGPWNYGCSILEFRGDKVARETIYIGQAWEAPEWRAPWRAEWKDEALSQCKGAIHETRV
jgi:hypothetical protein